MHVNHRRKNKYRRERPRWHVSLTWYKKDASTKRRAFERECIETERWDDLVNREPRSVLWDAL